MIYLDLLWTFFKMGCLTFGGGLAMLPVLERELVHNKGWTTMAEIMDYYVIGQITPGIIAVNVSTFIGYKKKGVTGGIIATAGFVLPSLIIITIIAAFLKNFSQIELVQHIFAGIRVAVCALVLNAVIKLFRAGVKDLLSAILFVIAAGLSLFLKASPTLLVFLAGCFGAALYFFRNFSRLKKGGPE